MWWEEKIYTIEYIFTIFEERKIIIMSKTKKQNFVSPFLFKVFIFLAWNMDWENPNLETHTELSIVYIWTS